MCNVETTKKFIFKKNDELDGLMLMALHVQDYYENDLKLNPDYDHVYFTINNLLANLRDDYFLWIINAEEMLNDKYIFNFLLDIYSSAFDKLDHIVYIINQSTTSNASFNKSYIDFIKELKPVLIKISNKLQALITFINAHINN